MTPPVRPQASRMRQLEALGHLQNRQRRNIFIEPIAKYLGQKQDVLEDFPGAILLPHSCHVPLL
jgi:hypothetical protein